MLVEAAEQLVGRKITREQAAAGAENVYGFEQIGPDPVDAPIAIDEAKTGELNSDMGRSGQRAHAIAPQGFSGFVGIHRHARMVDDDRDFRVARYQAGESRKL